MSAQIFIDKLEASNLLDSEIIGKLRKKIAKPGEKRLSHRRLRATVWKRVT